MSNIKPTIAAATPLQPPARLSETSPDEAPAESQQPSHHQRPVDDLAQARGILFATALSLLLWLVVFVVVRAW